MTDTDKDAGIIVLASIFIALGILAFVLILVVIISGSPQDPSPPPKGPVILNLLMFGIGWIIAGGLILTARMKWARMATIAIVSIMILRIGIAEVKVIMTATNISSLIEKSFFSTYTWVIVFLIFSVYYLTRSKVKEQFKRRGLNE